MSVQQTFESSEYAKTVAALVATMPVERAAQVYDFVRFLLAQPEQALASAPLPAKQESPLDDEDWLNDSEEEMQAEDVLWNATLARHEDEFNTLAETARAEIHAGKAQSMFNEQGEFAIDELPNHT